MESTEAQVDRSELRSAHLDRFSNVLQLRSTSNTSRFCHQINVCRVCGSAEHKNFSNSFLIVLIFSATSCLPGFALDLLSNEPDDDMPWDINSRSKREKAWKKVKDEKPFVVIGLPHALGALVGDPPTATTANLQLQQRRQTTRAPHLSRAP